VKRWSRQRGVLKGSANVSNGQANRPRMGDDPQPGGFLFPLPDRMPINSRRSSVPNRRFVGAEEYDVSVRRWWDVYDDAPPHKTARPASRVAQGRCMSRQGARAPVGGSRRSHADDHRRARGKCFTDRLRLKLRFGLAASELRFDAGNPITGVPQRLLRGRGDADARPASLTACRPLRTPSRTEGGRASRPWTVCALPSPTGTSADLDAILVRRRGSAGPTPDVGGPNCQGIVPFRQA
jgi:hypothetical protein